MAELDERLTGLVSALQRSILAHLVTEVLTRLDAAETERATIDGDPDPFAPTVDETPDQRALRQLELVASVVTGRIKLELSLMDRSLELTREINSASGTRGPGTFATVMVVDGAELADTGEERASEINLLTAARRERMQRFLDAWQGAVGAIRSSFDGFGA